MRIHPAGRLAALLLACCLCFCGIASAEETAAADLSGAQPLIDLTAAAAVSCAETPATITDGGVLTPEFVYCLFTLEQGRSEPLNTSSDFLTDREAAAAWIGRAYTSSMPDEDTMLLTEPTSDYIGVLTMEADVSDDGTAAKLIGTLYRASGRIDTLSVEDYDNIRWMDCRAVIGLKQDADAPGGWKITSFSAGDELAMEEAAENWNNSKMTEYVNSLGYSIQYPADFSDDVLVESERGISGKLADGTASFSVTAEDRESSQEEIRAAAEAAGAAVTVDDVSGCIRADSTDADGNITMTLYMVTGSRVYTATLTYSPELADRYSLYAEYMMNSFSVDELGVG